MAAYLSPDIEIKQLKVQIRRMTELLDYYRSTSQFEMDISVPPVNYFVSPMDNWTAGVIQTGRPVLIESNLGDFPEAVERCWQHLRTIDPYVEGRHRAAIPPRKKTT